MKSQSIKKLRSSWELNLGPLFLSVDFQEFQPYMIFITQPPIKETSGINILFALVDRGWTLSCATSL